MRKILVLIGAFMLGTTSSLQVTACTDDSKYKEFTKDVNSGHAFFGIIGAADDKVAKSVIDGLEIMQKKYNESTSQWDNWLKSHQAEITPVVSSGKIDVNIFERSAYANPCGDIVSQFWNDKSISWQKQIYHWLLDHQKDTTYSPPDAQSGVKEITPPTDKDRKFVALPIVFIVNKGKLVTVGQEWGTITNQDQFFNEFTSLLTGNLLKPNQVKTN